MNKQLKQGFTLVEIMIVVAIIGILAAIAVPNFVRSRRTSQQNACIANLRQIEAAKEQCQIEGLALNVDNVNKYLKVNLDNLHCPAVSTSTYKTTIGDENTPPSCPNANKYPGHKLEAYQAIDAGAGAGAGN